MQTTRKPLKLWISYPCWGKSTNDRFVPLTKGQWCGKRFRVWHHKYLSISDVLSSPTATVFPVAELIALCRKKGILTLLDAAHMPGQLAMDIEKLGADFLTGKYKWCAWSITDWGQVTHICVCGLTIIGSDTGLLPDLCQAIIRTNAGILSIGPLGTNFSEILVKMYTVPFIWKCCLENGSHFV